MFTSVPPETPRDRHRFDEKWERTPGGCHRWTGFFRSKQYGGFQIGYHTYRAHRVAYVWAYGEPDTDLHHTCGNAWCVNPKHLKPATIEEPQSHHRSQYENLCAHGHEFTPENTYINPRGERQCRECLRAASRRHAQANRERINAKKRASRQRVVYDIRPCEHCGRPYQPIRSTSHFCSERDCINSRQREGHRRRHA